MKMRCTHYLAKNKKWNYSIDDPECEAYFEMFEREVFHEVLR